MGYRDGHSTVRRLLAFGLLACLLPAVLRPPAYAGPLPVFSVRAFGAHCNGAGDDTAAIRRAAVAAGRSGGTLEFPAGTCLIHGTIYLGSHVHVIGHHSTLRAALPWQTPHPGAYALMENLHGAEAGPSDVDIAVRGLAFDYGDVGPGPVAGGGKHALRFVHASDIRIEHNTFQVRGGEDAVAGIAVQRMRVRGNQAFGFRNCAYDFWAGARQVTLDGNLARSSGSAQIVNFNPERSSGSSAGLWARGFRMTHNTLIGTGPRAIPVQLEPLGPATRVEDVLVADNRLDNVFLVLRGDVRHARIRDNSISHVRGGFPAIESYPRFGAAATDLSITGNRIDDAATAPSELGIVRVEAPGALIAGNRITGGTHAVPDIYRGTSRP